MYHGRYMKLITLNAWGGRAQEKLLKFLKARHDIDIFCFQEVYNGVNKSTIDKEYLQDAFELYTDFTKALPGHVGYFRPHIEDWYGLAIFVKKGITVKREGDIMIHDVIYTGGGNIPRNLQFIEIENDGATVTIANVHGLWNGKGKTDSDARIVQSQKIRAFLDATPGSKVLCGDFNLLPHTESLRMVEQGMVNLIREHNVQSTRTSLYTKPEKFADYVFVTPDITVRDFKVLPDEVSDHAALYVEF